MTSENIKIINNGAAKVGNKYVDLEVLNALMADKYSLKQYANAIENIARVLTMIDIDKKKNSLPELLTDIEMLNTLKEHLSNIDITECM